MPAPSDPEPCQPLRQLGVSGSTFADLFRHLPAPMLISTVEGEVLDLNLAMSELLAADAQLLLGARPSDMPLTESRARLEEALRELKSVPHLTKEIRFLRNGQEFWALARFMRVPAHGRSTFVVMNIEDLTERRRTEERLAAAARSDPLTGLANRTAIMERLDDGLAAVGDQVMMVAFCDVDGLKDVNDRRGHQAGDLLLAETARRFKHTCHPDDTVGRLSGDEFVVVGLRAGQAEAEDQVSAVLAALRHPMDIGGEPENVTVSIGLAVGNGEVSGAALLSAADDAMYQAKRQGAGRWRLATL